jgi:hypothetical protein
MPSQQIVCVECADKYGQDYDCKRTMILAGPPGLKGNRCPICKKLIPVVGRYYWMNDEYVEKAKEKHG